MSTITIHGTYRHVDGTPARGSISVRPVVTFKDVPGAATVVADWVTATLDPLGAVTLTIDWPDSTDPAPVWLQVLETVDCMRGGVWQIGPQLLTPGASIDLADARVLPASHVDTPKYIPVPGAKGDPGPQGPKGDKGDPGAPGGLQWDDIMGMVPQPFNAGSTYAEGDIVLFNGSPWVAKKPTQAGDSPASAPGKWLVLDVEAVALKAAHAQQAVADLKLDDLTDVSAPAGTQAGMLLGTTGTGAWGPVPPGDTVILRGPGKGIEMRSPDGARWLVTIADGGTVQVVAAP